MTTRIPTTFSYLSAARAYAQGDDDGERQWLLPLAEAGDAAAQCRLALLRLAEGVFAHTNRRRLIRDGSLSEYSPFMRLFSVTLQFRVRYPAGAFCLSGCRQRLIARTGRMALRQVVPRLALGAGSYIMAQHRRRAVHFIRAFFISAPMQAG